MIAQRPQINGIASYTIDKIACLGYLQAPHLMLLFKSLIDVSIDTSQQLQMLGIPHQRRVITRTRHTMLLQNSSDNLLLICVEVGTETCPLLLLHLKQALGSMNIDQKVDHLFLFEHEIRTVDTRRSDRKRDQCKNEIQEFTHARLFLVSLFFIFIIRFLQTYKILTEEENEQNYTHRDAGVSEIEYRLEEHERFVTGRQPRGITKR